MRFFLTLALVAFSASTAPALPTLIIDDLTVGGGAEVIITAGSPITFSHNLSTNNQGLTNWDQITASAATGGGPNDFLMNLNNFSFLSQGAGKIVVAYIDSFSPAGPSFTAPAVTSVVTPSKNGGKIQFSTEFDTSGAVGTPGSLSFATGSVFADPENAASAVFTGLPASYSELITAPVSTYSVAMVALIEATGAGQTFTFDWNVTGVPEPGFYGLLALALSGLFFFGFRRRSSAGEIKS